MNKTQRDANEIASKLKAQLKSFGFPNCDLKLQDLEGSLKADGPGISFSLTAPQTVLQLRTLAQHLHFKYLKDENGNVVGTTYALAESSNDRPLGLVDANRGQYIMNTVSVLDAAFKELPAKRPIDDPAWNDKDYADIILKGVTFSAIRAEFGGITSQRRQGRGIKTGPKPRTLEEAIEIVEQWRRWDKSGQSQEIFAHHRGWKSRTILSDCIRMCREAFGDDFI